MDISRGSQLLSKKQSMQTVELNDFDIKEQIGRGAFGRVFLAILPAAQKHYAIKVIRKDKILIESSVERT